MTFLSVAFGEPTALRGCGRLRVPQATVPVALPGTRETSGAKPTRLQTSELGMEKITVAVLRTQGGWRVMKDDRQIGEYDFRVDAEDAGLKLTRQIHLSGRDVELLVQTEGSHDVTPMRGWETVH
ncbi:hypothetical protein [Brevundimonas sp.]